MVAADSFASIPLPQKTVPALQFWICRKKNRIANRCRQRLLSDAVPIGHLRPAVPDLVRWSDEAVSANRFDFSATVPPLRCSLCATAEAGRSQRNRSADRECTPRSLRSTLLGLS